jgi:uncharacterized protein (DUF1697 family)
MTRYVALLRGINVGGNVLIKMTDLAELVRGLGYDDVKTVLASGNVLFTTKDAAATARRKLEAALTQRFGYEAWVQVLSVTRLRAIVDAYPFDRREGWQHYVVFVPDGGVRASILAVEHEPEQDLAEEGDGVIYWSVPRGRTLESPFTRAQNTAKTRPHVTNRNINTLEKLLR